MSHAQQIVSLMKAMPIKKKKSKKPEGDAGISAPISVSRTAHVGYNHDTGQFEGLTPEMKALLGCSGLTATEMQANPEGLLKCLQFQTSFLNNGGAPPPLPNRDVGGAPSSSAAVPPPPPPPDRSKPAAPAPSAWERSSSPMVREAPPMPPRSGPPAPPAREASPAAPAREVPPMPPRDSPAPAAVRPSNASRPAPARAVPARTETVSVDDDDEEDDGYWDEPVAAAPAPPTRPASGSSPTVRGRAPPPVPGGGGGGAPRGGAAPPRGGGGGGGAPRGGAPPRASVGGPGAPPRSSVGSSPQSVPRGGGPPRGGAGGPPRGGAGGPPRGGGGPPRGGAGGPPRGGAGGPPRGGGGGPPRGGGAPAPNRGGAGGARGGSPASPARAPAPSPVSAPTAPPPAAEPAPVARKKPTGPVRIEDVVTPENPRSRFLNMKQIGQGASGTVYVADDTRTGQKVAVKEMVLDQQPNKEIIVNEILLMKACTHRAIVNFIDSYLCDGALWVVMEFIDGCDLTQIIEACSPMQEDHIATIMRECLSALEHLHVQDIIHRDIKSDNIMVAQDGRIKLTDFGYGAQLTKERDKRKTVVGTPYWMAPEVIQGEDYDTKADVWSTGVMCMEMIDGLPPYMDFPPLKALYQIVSYGLPPPENEAMMSPEFKDFLQTCTIFEHDTRPSCTELLKHPFLQSAGGTSSLSELVARARAHKENDY